MGSTYTVISIICFALAGVMLVLGIVLFFVLKINRVIGYFTGKTERKSIEEMKAQKENKVVAYSYADQVQSDGVRKITAGITEEMNTTSTEHYEENRIMSGSGTMVLGEMYGTTVLGQQNGTTVLSQEELDIGKINIIKNIIIIHTNEVI